MKKYVQTLIIAFVAFIVVAYFYPGFTYHRELQILLYAAVVFSLLTLFVKPLVKILMLPINLITFGFLNFVSNLIILYAVTYIVPNFKIVAFHFAGFSFSGFVFPAFDLGQFISALVVSLLIGTIMSVLQWGFH